MHEYQEQQAIEQIALSRHKDATGVKDIQPFLTGNEQEDYWFVILTTATAFEFLTTIVTAEDNQKATA